MQFYQYHFEIDQSYFLGYNRMLILWWSPLFLKASICYTYGSLINKGKARSWILEGLVNFIVYKPFKSSGLLEQKKKSFVFFKKKSGYFLSLFIYISYNPNCSKVFAEYKGEFGSACKSVNLTCTMNSSVFSTSILNH